MMLYDLIQSGYGTQEDFNCAEKILYGANKAYDMGLSQETLKLAGGFGGGMYVGDTCGAVTAGIMVLSHFFNESVAHQSPKLKGLIIEFQTRYTNLNQSTNCITLKENYRTDEFGCLKIISDAAQILDEMLRNLIVDK